jgi:serine/threonine protein kinase
MKDPLIGQRLANFRVERVLGRGGMAQVYYGQDVKLQRPVAIKVIDARYRDKPAYARRFVNEARVLAKWHHEHIIQIYYADDEDDLYYYVMEYIDGQNLAAIMASYAVDGELMPIEDVLHIGSAIADALDYAHKQGVIHRDVKPSNILVARDGRVVLGDFGLAMDLQDGSLGETFGTPHYISPEQASRSANAIPQSDLYSLGVILYEMLVGVVPFNDPSPTSVALQHITEQPPAPRSINPELPVEADHVLLKALEKSPQQRYQTGFELIAALKQALTVKPAAAIAPLPPLPVGVPTISKRTVSKESVTRRVASAPLTGYASPQKPEEIAQPKQPDIQKDNRLRRRTLGFSRSWFLFFSLLFLAIISFVWWQGWFQPGAFSKIIPLRPVQPTVIVLQATNSPTVAAITQTAQPSLTIAPTSSPLMDEPVTPPPTSTASPSPTTTYTPTTTFTPTITYTPTDTYTPTTTYTPRPTSTVRATLTANPALPAKYPDGHFFRLYYNENSLYLQNLSNVTRSISGFTFERLDDQGKALNFFGGWDWGLYYSNINPNRCMAIELYLSPPFLKPPECEEPYLSLLNPARDSAKVFWTTQENSHEFRVSWQRDEITRCTVGAGVCEFRIP